MTSNITMTGLDELDRSLSQMPDALDAVIDAKLSRVAQEHHQRFAASAPVGTRVKKSGARLRDGLSYRKGKTDLTHFSVSKARHTGLVEFGHVAAGNGRVVEGSPHFQFRSVADDMRNRVYAELEQTAATEAARKVGLDG